MTAQTIPKRGVPPHFFVDEAWLALRDEEVLDAALPIVDPHHHLWETRRSRYLLPDLLADIGSGHNIRATVYAECQSMYNADAEPRFASVGEVEFVNGVAATRASGLYGALRLCAGIVGRVDLTQGAAAQEVLEACIARAPSRFRGIRQMAAWDPSPEISNVYRRPPKDLLADRKFREGFACLGPLNLSFGASVYHPQLSQVIDLADAFTATTIVLDHLGAPVGIGPYAGRRNEVFDKWKRSIQALAKRPNVVVKLGGIGMHLGGFDFIDRDLPPTSLELAQAWQRYIDTCIESFGPGRAMFESNFPVDKCCCTYRVLWNAFKRMASAYSASEKRELFAGSAVRAYRLPPELAVSAEQRN